MRHSPFTAIFDACVFYSAPLRDFLMCNTYVAFRSKRASLYPLGEVRRLFSQNLCVQPSAGQFFAQARILGLKLRNGTGRHRPLQHAA